MSGGEIEFLTEEEDIGFTMSSPTPNKVRVCPEDFPLKGDLVEEQMERRVASGEFRLASGEVDFVAMNEVMRQLIDQPTKTKFNTICSLWAKEGITDPSKKVMFECNAVQKEVVIPAGVKVLVLKNTGKNNEKSPDASVVYLTEEIL